MHTVAIMSSDCLDSLRNNVEIQVVHALKVRDSEVKNGSGRV